MSPSTFKPIDNEAIRYSRLVRRSFLRAFNVPVPAEHASSLSPSVDKPAHNGDDDDIRSTASIDDGSRVCRDIPNVYLRRQHPYAPKLHEVPPLRPHAQQQTQTQRQPQPLPQTRLRPQARPQPLPQTPLRPQPRPQPLPKTRLQPQPRPQPFPHAPLRPQPRPQPLPKTPLQPRARPQPLPQGRSKPPARPNLHPFTRPQSQVRPHPHLQSQLQSQSKSQSQSQSQSLPQLRLRPQPQIRPRPPQYPHSRADLRPRQQQFYTSPRTTCFFQLLPADVCERIAAFTAVDGPVSLLNLAESCLQMRLAVVAASRFVLDLDERMLPQTARWAAIFQRHVRTLHVHHRLRRFDVASTLPPLQMLLAAPTLRHVTMPAIPALFKVLASAPRLTSLSVYLRNREDVHAFLTCGTARAVDVNNEDTDHVDGRAQTPFGNVTELCIRCVQADEDDAQIDPFCFASHCATELLATQCEWQRELQENPLKARFPRITSLRLHCHHRLPCDIWPVVSALPNVSQVALDAPIDLNDGAVARLHRINSVELCNVRDGARLAVSLARPVAKLVAYERALTMDDVAALRVCTQLRDVRIAIESGAEAAIIPLAPRLTTLALRWIYSEADLALARAHGVIPVPYCYSPDSNALLQISAAAISLTSLHLEFACISISTLREILRNMGACLIHFVTSIECQSIQADLYLIEILHAVREYCPQLRSLRFHEVSEGTEHRYRVSLPDNRKQNLRSALKLLKSRAPFLDLHAADEAVCRMCDEHPYAWSRSPW